MYVHLKCKDDIVDGILSGDIRTTWRCMGIDDNNDRLEKLAPGEKFVICDTQEVQVAMVEVEWVKDTRIAYITNEDMKYHEKHSSPHEILVSMREYYPEHELDLDTVVKVIRFTVTRVLKA